MIILNSQKSVINVEIDTDIKKDATELLSRMGIDQTTAIEIYFRKIIAIQALPFQPEPIPSNKERLLTVIKQKKIPNITLPADENGNAFIDKEKYPELYDWAVNG